MLADGHSWRRRTVHDETTAGHPADRRGLLERRDRRTAWRLTEDGQGALRHPALEAARQQTKADSAGVPGCDGREPSRRPRAGGRSARRLPHVRLTTRGITARRPRETAGVGTPPVGRLLQIALIS